MGDYLLIGLAGFAGSAHCVGMCGGFACALGADSRGAVASVARHLVYNLGRVTSYCFVGAVVGHLGVLLVGHGGESSWASLAQRLLAVTSGLLMIYIGLQFVGSLRRGSRGSAGPGAGWLAQALRQLIRAPSLAAPLAFGVLNGLLPCPLVYAFAAQAAGSGGPLEGLLVMAAFGAGTFPAMLLMGGVGRWLRRAAAPNGVVTTDAASLRAAAAGVDWRHQGVRLAGGFIVLLGLITLARGVLPLGAHMHGV